MNELLRKILFLPEQVSTVARDIDHLHFFVIIVTMIGAFGVAVFTLYFIIKYRESAHRGGELPPDARPHRSPAGVPWWVEAGVIAGLFALFLLFWVIGFGQFVRISEPPRDSLTIYVTGKQWMWSFAYPNGAGSNGVLYVPVNRPVKLVLTSRDVIHSFFVPEFRLKQDAVPGRSTQMWFEATRPGRYPIYCTEYCGMAHSTMLGEIVVVSGAEYEQKLGGLEPVRIAGPQVQLPATPGEGRVAELVSLAAVGERVAAEAGCLRCHTVDGTPHIGPTFAGLFGARIPLEDGKTIVADETYLTSSMMDPAAQLHRGFTAVMPSYQGLLSAPQVGALVEYIRSLQYVPRVDGNVPLPADTGQPVPLVTPLPPVEQQAANPAQAPGARPPLRSEQPAGAGKQPPQIEAPSGVVVPGEGDR